MYLQVAWFVLAVFFWVLKLSQLICKLSSFSIPPLLSSSLHMPLISFVGPWSPTSNSQVTAASCQVLSASGGNTNGEFH